MANITPVERARAYRILRAAEDAVAELSILAKNRPNLARELAQGRTNWPAMIGWRKVDAAENLRLAKTIELGTRTILKPKLGRQEPQYATTGTKLVLNSVGFLNAARLWPLRPCPLPELNSTTAGVWFEAVWRVCELRGYISPDCPGVWALGATKEPNPKEVRNEIRNRLKKDFLSVTGFRVPKNSREECGSPGVKLSAASAQQRANSINAREHRKRHRTQQGKRT